MLAFSQRNSIVRTHWSGALIAFGIAGLLIGFRDVLPVWLANILANMIIGVSVVLIHRGTLIMACRPPPDGLYFISVFALGAIYYQFTIVTPDVGIRLFFVSIFRVPYFISSAVTLRSTPRFRTLFSTTALIWLLAAGAGWYLLRGCLALSSNEWAVLLRTGSMQSVNFLIAAAGNILITVALSRVEAEQAIHHASALAVQLQAQSDGLEAAVLERTRELEAEVLERKAAERAETAEKERAEAALEDLLATQHHLIQAEKMASLGRLVAGAAHEINTPLGVAVTMGSLLSDRLNELAASLGSGRLKKQEMERFVAEAQEGFFLQLANLGRAADLIQSFKQVAADQVSDDRRQFQMNTLLFDIMISLGPVWRKPGHRVDIACRDPIELVSYPGVISQILTNLITNSVIHGFEAGRRGVLTIEAVLVDPGTVELSYSDNGAGIAAEARGKVFEPFFTTRRSLGSTGLGLHIVYNLVVAKLAGTIDLYSEVGQGVRFVMRFPRSLDLPPASRP